MKFNVVEIFDSLEGEGIRAGLPATFIRLAGCNMRCVYCDTEYALYTNGNPPEYTALSTEEIVTCVNSGYKRVTLTGGEPLMYPDALGLINALALQGNEINIETNGSIDISVFRNGFCCPDKVFFTIDYKLPSSGVCDRMLWQNFQSLNSADVVKFVVGSRDDIRCLLDTAERILSIYKEPPHIFIGAVYGKIENSELAELILREPLLKNARLQLQIHKIIWDPLKRGV